MRQCLKGLVPRALLASYMTSGKIFFLQRGLTRVSTHCRFESAITYIKELSVIQWYFFYHLQSLPISLSLSTMSFQDLSDL